MMNEDYGIPCHSMQYAHAARPWDKTRFITKMKKGDKASPKEIEDLKAKINFLEFQLSALMKEIAESKNVRR